jgi:hypothetical protein
MIGMLLVCQCLVLVEEEEEDGVFVDMHYY